MPLLRHVRYWHTAYLVLSGICLCCGTRAAGTDAYRRTLLLRRVRASIHAYSAATSGCIAAIFGCRAAASADTAAMYACSAVMLCLVLAVMLTVLVFPLSLPPSPSLSPSLPSFLSFPPCWQLRGRGAAGRGVRGRPWRRRVASLHPEGGVE
eukprot:3156736-Rhodomonas_salina.1